MLNPNNPQYEKLLSKSKKKINKNFWVELDGEYYPLIGTDGNLVHRSSNNNNNIRNEIKNNETHRRELRELMGFIPGVATAVGILAAESIGVNAGLASGFPTPPPAPEYSIHKSNEQLAHELENKLKNNEIPAEEIPQAKINLEGLRIRANDDSRRRGEPIPYPNPSEGLNIPTPTPTPIIPAPTPITPTPIPIIPTPTPTPTEPLPRKPIPSVTPTVTPTPIPTPSPIVSAPSSSNIEVEIPPTIMETTTEILGTGTVGAIQNELAYSINEKIKIDDKSENKGFSDELLKSNLKSKSLSELIKLLADLIRVYGSKLIITYGHANMESLLKKVKSNLKNKELLIEAIEDIRKLINEIDSKPSPDKSHVINDLLASGSIGVVIDARYLNLNVGQLSAFLSNQGQIQGQGQSQIQTPNQVPIKGQVEENKITDVGVIRVADKEIPRRRINDKIFGSDDLFIVKEEQAKDVGKIKKRFFDKNQKYFKKY